MKITPYIYLCSLLISTTLMPAYATDNIRDPKVHRKSIELPKIFGKTYGEWSKNWWLWALSSEPAKPDEEGNIDCNDGQKGKVWYLAGTFGGEPIERTCIDPIPPGKALFFPLVNAVFINEEGENFNVQEKRGLINDFIDTFVCNISSTVNGVPTIFTNPTVRTQSPPFPLLGDAETISDGYWVMLPSLPKGEHTVHIVGEFCELGFVVDVTYHLSIGGKRH